MSTYAERFADAVRAELPDTFTVYADTTQTIAYLGMIVLFAFTPTPDDKRQPILPADVRSWRHIATRAPRRDMAHYTPAAKEAATAVLAVLEARNLEVPA